MTNRTPVKTAVKNLIELGFKVSKCRPGTKSPFGKTWQDSIIADESQVNEQTCIGLLTEPNELVVLDIDAYENESNTNELMGIIYNTFPELLNDYPREQTPTGGYHFYFKADKSLYSKTASKILKCEGNDLPFDVRANGGFIVCSPSKYPSFEAKNDSDKWKEEFIGNRYVWEIEIGSIELKPMPKALSDLLAAGKCQITQNENGQKIFVPVIEQIVVKTQIQSNADNSTGLIRDLNSLKSACSFLKEFPQLFNGDIWFTTISKLVATYGDSRGGNVDLDNFAITIQEAFDPERKWESENLPRITSLWTNSHLEYNQPGALINFIKYKLGEDNLKNFMKFMIDANCWTTKKSQLVFEEYADIHLFYEVEEVSIQDITAFITACIRYIENSGKPYYLVYDEGVWIAREYDDLEKALGRFKVTLVESEFIDLKSKDIIPKTSKNNTIALSEILKFKTVKKSISYARSRAIAYTPNEQKAIEHKTFNLFSGYAARLPVDLELLEPDYTWRDFFLNHIKEIICNSNQQDYDYTIRWLAQAVAQPRNLMRTALIITGNEGSGKSIVFNVIFRELIFGVKNSIQYSSIADYFDPQDYSKRSSIFTILNEASGSGLPKKTIQLLKGVVTDKLLHINPKYDKHVEMNTIPSNFVITSNFDLPFKIPSDDRRYVVLATNNKYAAVNRHGDKEKEEAAANYFKKLASPTETDIAHLLQYFLEFDLADFDADKIPKNDAKANMKLLSLSGGLDLLLRFYHDTLPVDISGTIIQKDSQIYISYHELYRYYSTSYAQAMGIKKIESNKTFTNSLVKLFGETKRFQIGGSRYYGVVFTKEKLKQVLIDSIGENVFNKAAIKEEEETTDNIITEVVDDLFDDL
jgi:hypothetical protein